MSPAAALLLSLLLAADAPTGAVPVSQATLHDGDTVSKCNIELPFGVTLRNRSIRAFGYDAWEVTRTRQTVTVTDAEIVKGKAATAALIDLINTGSLYVEDSGQRDPYGRISGRLWVKRGDVWIDVARWMMERGHTRRETEP